MEEGSEAVDDISREVLLNTCGQLKQSFKKLNKHAQDARFQELCARVVSNSSTADADVSRAGLSASRAGASASGPSSGSRLVVPTGKKPLDIFDYRVWTKMDPVVFWYGDCVWGHPSRPVPLAMGEHHDMCMRRGRAGVQYERGAGQQ